MPPQSASISNISANENDTTLVDQLNALLSSLNIPITLLSPAELTPSLLIAILESVLGMRLPMIDRNRETKNSKASKIQNMKIFLGVLETDILKTDVGLSDVDPRRLADGEWEEVTYIAELLCWMAQQMNSKRSSKAQKVRHEDRKTVAIRSRCDTFSKPPRLSPKSQLDLDAESVFQTGSTITTGSSRPSGHLFSPFVKNMDQKSTTSLNSQNHPDKSTFNDDYSDDVSDVLSALPPFTKSYPPKSIHEIPSPSLLFSGNIQCPSDPPDNKDLNGYKSRNISSIGNSNSLRDFSPDHSRSSVRYTGYIEPVDEDFELASFELSKSISSNGSFFGGEKVFH